MAGNHLPQRQCHAAPNFSSITIRVNEGISPREYEAFRSFIEEACGIVLGENKHYLVVSRLTRLMADNEFKTLSELIEHLRLSPNSPIRDKVVNAMTTNETLWFRDGFPFEVLREKILHELAQRRHLEPIRIWSAACSTGQEPYSISMIAQEYINSRRGTLPTLQIIATDISSKVLAEAKSGMYDAAALARGLSQERKERFFQKKGNGFAVNDDIRNRVTFNDINLMKSFAHLGKFDVIFCRNVLIYFSADLKKNILGRFEQSLKSGGHIILGASESMANYSADFETIRHDSGMVYRSKK